MGKPTKLMRKIKEELNKQRDIPWSWAGRLKIAILSLIDLPHKDVCFTR